MRLSLVMFSFLLPLWVSGIAAVAYSGITLAERYESRQARKSLLSLQFIIMKIAGAQVCSPTVNNSCFSPWYVICIRLAENSHC